MKHFSFWGLLAMAALALVVYSCAKDNEVAPGDDLSTVEEEARVITYQGSQAIPGQYIVVFKDGATGVDSRSVTRDNYRQAVRTVRERAVQVLRERGVRQAEPLQTYAKTLRGVAVRLTDDEVANLRRDDRIAYIEQDQTVQITMGGPPGGGGGGGSTGETVPWGITRVNGGVSGATGKAWVIDSGVDLDHEDLNVDTQLSQSFLSGGGGASSPDDQNGHGTHVAGTIAAVDNEVGVIGVAAGASVVAVRVLDRRGSGSISGVVAGVDYVGATASNGDVANMSLGGGASTTLDNAVSNAASACAFVIAAGNSSADANNYSPARVNGNNIYTVSSMAQGDVWSSFSNYGNPPVDYCAPGSSVLSTYENGGYATLSGTSMAAPHVAGILLLGNISSTVNVSGDPDGNPDPIAEH